MRVHLNNDTVVDTISSVSDLDQTCNSYIKFVSGESCSDFHSADDMLAVRRLKTFVDLCPDVYDRKFESMEVHADVDDRPRVAIVHAEIVCDWERHLVSVHDEMSTRFISSLLLGTAAQQLGCDWQVVTSMMLTCASNRFTTLMTVAEHQHIELSPVEIELLDKRCQQHPHPELHHFVNWLGGRKMGFRKTMAAVANGFLRLGDHSILSMIVAVHPGPMLSTGRPPSPCGLALSPNDARSLAA
jgi:hypothetical protein